MKILPFYLAVLFLSLAAVLAACNQPSAETATPTATILQNDSTTAPLTAVITTGQTTHTAALSTATDQPLQSTFPLLTTAEPTTVSPATTTAPLPQTTPAVTTTVPAATTAIPVTTTQPITTPTPIPTTTAPQRPIEPDLCWIVSGCEEYISLRSAPSAAAYRIVKIPLGQAVELIAFTGNFAKVNYNGQIGFVNAYYLSRPDGLGSAEDLTVVKPVENYSYAQMNADLHTLVEKFPDLLRLSSIGQSEEGRELTLAILGNPEADRRIFVQAAIHGREHIVAQISVSEIDYILHHPDLVLEGGMTVATLLEQVAIHIVPMSNPDGVTIVQSLTVPPPFADIYPTQETALRWKANALGIDLNANFDALWERYESIYQSTSPAFAGYKGSAPECAKESKALADYLRAGDFDLTLSYHTSGSLIYWSFDYENHVEVNEQSRDLAQAVSRVTGFYLGEQESTSSAGFKDYAMMALGIPSLTLEFAISDAPADFREFEQIWARSKLTVLTAALWSLEQKH